MKTKGLPTIRELFLDGRVIDRAMRRAVQEALLRHKRAGVSVAVWRSGEVVRLRPSQIKVSRDTPRRSPRPSKNSSTPGRGRAGREGA